MQIPDGTYKYNKKIGKETPDATVKIEGGKIHLQKGSEIHRRSRITSYRDRKSASVVRRQEEAEIENGILQNDLECPSLHYASTMVSGHVKAHPYKDWKAESGLAINEYVSNHALWGVEKSEELLINLYRWIDIRFTFQPLVRDYHYYQENYDAPDLLKSMEKNLNALLEESGKLIEVISNCLVVLTPDQRMQIFGCSDWDKKYTEAFLHRLDWIINDSLGHGFYPNDEQKFVVIETAYQATVRDHR